MKIFWSWQSDNDEKWGRYFVRDVLKGIAKNLNQADSIDEADRDERIDRVELDHDTSGVSGSPPIAQTILAKIAEAGVFVADVTPIGTTKNGGKHLANPNVMLELGYALALLKYERIVLVMNEACNGHPDNLPFDLKHVRWPIGYKLSMESSPSERVEERRKLTLALTNAVKPALAAAKAKMQESRRLSHPQPDFSVELVAAEGELPRIISQAPSDLAVACLSEIQATHAKKSVPDVDRVLERRSFEGPIVPGLSRRVVPPELWTREETESYNRQLDNYYRAYENYLDEIREHRLRELRSLSVRLKLSNSGNIPGTDIDVEVDIPDGLILIDPENPPDAPKAPQPPSLDLQRRLYAQIVPSRERFPLLTPAGAQRTVIDTERGQVRFHVENLKHHYSRISSTFLLVFDTPESIHLQMFPHTVSCNEIPDLKRGEILLDVAVAENE